MRFSSSRVLASLIVVVLVALPSALVVGAGSASAQSYTPNPTINSATVSGNSAVVSYTIPPAPEVGGEQFEGLLVAQTPTEMATGELVDWYNSCDNETSNTGSGTCTFEDLDPGTNYIQLETTIQGNWGDGEPALGCAVPAAQASEYPDGSGACFSTLYSVVVGSATVTPTHKPIALLPIVADVPPSNGTAACDDAIGQLDKDNGVAALINPVIIGINSEITKADAGGTWSTREQNLYEYLVNLYSTGWSVQVVGNLQAKDLADAEKWCTSHAAVKSALVNNIFQALPVPQTNGSAACNADITKINYDNTMLSRAFGQLSFRAQSLATNFDQTVPNQQLWTQIGHLDGQLSPVWSKAWTKDCTKL